MDTWTGLIVETAEIAGQQFLPGLLWSGETYVETAGPLGAGLAVVLETGGQTVETALLI